MQHRFCQRADIGPRAASDRSRGVSMDFHDVVTGSADDGGLRGGESYAQQVADAKALAATSLDGALQNLLGFEKTARLSGNVAGTRELVTAMVELCHASGDWQVLNETIALLAKRRAQLKQAVIAMVQLASTYVDAQPDQKLKVQLIDTLRSVSEGKLFVEVERARLTKLLAEMHEAKGEVEEARKLMQDTQVETLGGMDKREKTTFILEQVRLCLDTGDFVRAQIMAKKISTKVFKDPDLEELKLRYYALIVRYERHGHNWMAIFRAFQARRAPSDAPHRHRPASSQRARCCVCVPQAMWDSPGLQADEAQAHRGLKLQVRRHGSDACMPPFGSRIGDPTSSTPGAVPRPRPLRLGAVERHARPLRTQGPQGALVAANVPLSSAAVARAGRRGPLLPPELLRDPAASTVPWEEALKPVAACRYRSLLKCFITQEIFHFTELKDGLAAELAAFGDAEFTVSERALMLETLHTRVTQHNIQVVAAGYSRVTMERLAHLLGLPMARMEEQLCEMVVKKQARTATRLGYRHRHRHGLRRDHTADAPPARSLTSRGHAPQTPAPPSTPPSAPPFRCMRASRAPMGLSPSPRRRRRMSYSTTGRATFLLSSTTSRGRATSSTRRTCCTRSREDRGGAWVAGRLR